MFILNFRAFMYIYKKQKIVPSALTSVYIVILIAYIIFVPTELKNEDLNSHENIFTVMDIYGVNKYILFEETPDLTNAEIEFIKEALEIIPENSEYICASNSKAIAWSYPLTGELMKNRLTETVSGQTRIDYTYLTLKQMLLKADYAILLKHDYEYSLTNTEAFDNYEIVYETDLGILAVNTNPDKSW